MTWLLVSHPTQYRGAGCLSSNNTLFLQALRTSCGLQTGRQTLALKCWNRHRDNFLCESGILHRGSFLLASFVEGGTLPLADKCPVIVTSPASFISRVFRWCMNDSTLSHVRNVCSPCKFSAFVCEFPQ